MQGEMIYTVADLSECMDEGQHLISMKWPGSRLGRK